MALTDSGRPEGSGSPADAGDVGGSTVGTVAEEAARLVEMLAGASGPWTRVNGGSPGPATGQAGGHATGARSNDVPGGAEGGQAEPDGDTGRAASGHTCTCGGTTPQACRLCPVCQVISLVNSISPETIDRAADLVDLAATALRDLATVQRGRQAAAERSRASDGDDS